MMSFYRISTPMAFYGGDYRPDDEPPLEAVLEEKQILEHQIQRPSPSRCSFSTATSIRLPVVARQDASRSLRTKALGSSPRRSLQRSSAFSNRKSMTINDRGRTASMPVVPIVRIFKLLKYWKFCITIFLIITVLCLDPDPVILYRSKINHKLSNQNTTIVSTIARHIKAIIFIIQAYKSIEVLNICIDLKLIENRLNIREKISVTLMITFVGVFVSILELLFDYQIYSLSNLRLAYIEGITRISLFTIELQFCSICTRIAKIYKNLHDDLQLNTFSSSIGRPNYEMIGLAKTVSEFGALSIAVSRTNRAYVGQLSLIVGLHFIGVLVDVYLFCFHAISLAVPWTVDSIGGVRTLNNLWQLSVVSGAAHYSGRQALHIYQKMGQIRTSRLETEDIKEIEMFFVQYDPNNVSFKLLGSVILDLSLTILSSFGNVPRPDGPVLEEYRLRSFSITASGVCNLGDFVRYASPQSSTRHHQIVGKRESCPASVSGTPLHQQYANATAASPAITSATSHTVCTEFSRFRKPSTALINKFKANDTVESYKVALLGAPGVGKTTISVQFSTSEYICVYDTSIDEDCACRTIRVMINGQEAELTIIDIPYTEMSIETLCSTYNPNVFIVMYSVVDQRSFDIAEQMLLFLWKGEYIHTRGVILVGNKADLERTRKIQTNVGRNLAYSWNCKFIETSSGIDHNVDKLLVGILAQIKLNPIRERMYNSKRKKYSVTKLYKDFLAYLRGVKSSENLFSI